MKKFLLSLAAVLCAGSLAMADEATVQLNSSTGFTGNANAYTATNSGFTFTYAKASSTNDCHAPYSDHIRIYKDAEFTVEAADSVTITGMVMITTGSKYKGFNSASTGSGSWSSNTYTWTGTANKVTLTSGSSQTRPKSIVITYTIVELKEGAEGEGIEENPYNAIAAYNEAIVGSTAKVYVTGIISEITEIETASYGNATYYISTDGTTTDQFCIYRGYALGGLKFTSEDQIKVGDNVVVYGNLTTYQGNPQIAQGSEIVKLNGEIYTIDLEGDGTESKPFTVADVIKINPTETTSNTSYPDKYWITGYIVGACNGNALEVTTNISDITANANIVLSATAESTTEIIPIQLPSGNVRSSLNLVDNPTNLGKQVSVYGNIYKYFSAPGVKNTTEFKLGTVAVDAIDADDNDAPVEYFNLQGVRVDEPQNGLYIRRQGSTVTKVIVK